MVAGADELGDEVRRNTVPRKIASQCEAQCHRWVEVCSGNGSHEEDDCDDHQPWSHDTCRQGDGVGEASIDDAATHGYEDEQKRPEIARGDSENVRATLRLAGRPTSRALWGDHEKREPTRS